MFAILKLGTSIFELGLFGLLIFTLIYARRLDRSIVRLRADREILKDLLEQIGSSIAAAVAATDRLRDQANQGVAALDDACQAAAVSTRKLDELISNATLAASRLRAVVAEDPAPRESEAKAPPHNAPAPAPAAARLAVVPASTERMAAPSSRPAATRRIHKPQSRAERDLARMLLDAS